MAGSDIFQETQYQSRFSVLLPSHGSIEHVVRDLTFLPLILS